jgi:hypothetical protein
LLGKLGGELQTGGNVHLGVAVNLDGSQSEPQTLEDLELATAQLIAEATSNFDPAEISRLKALLDSAFTASPSSSTPAAGHGSVIRAVVSRA